MIVRRFQEMRDEKQQLAQKISEMNVEKNEHSMVVDTLGPLDPNRKAWRLVGGVLVERTCGEVLPAVQESLTQIEAVVGKLTETHEEKEKELTVFMEKYNIRLQGGAAPVPTKAAESEGGTGVLVS